MGRGICLPTRPLSAVRPALITGLEGTDLNAVHQSAVIRPGYGHYRQIRLVVGVALGGPITRGLGRTDAIFSSGPDAVAPSATAGSPLGESPLPAVSRWLGSSVLRWPELPIWRDERAWVIVCGCGGALSISG